MPGPDRQKRRDAARQGLAFGLGELEGALRVLADNGIGVHQSAGIEVRGCAPETGAAALLCARALAEFLWQEAGRVGFWTDALKRSVPAIARSGAPEASAQDLVLRDVLEQMAASSDPVVAREYCKDIRAARDILARWRTLGIAAEAYGGVGAFGCLCAANFGVKRPLRNDCAAKPPFMTKLVN